MSKRPNALQIAIGHLAISLDDLSSDHDRIHVPCVRSQYDGSNGVGYRRQVEVRAADGRLAFKPREVHVLS